MRTALGDMLAGTAGGAVCLLEFDNPGRQERQINTLRKLFRVPVLAGGHPVLDRLEQQLDEYFAGRRTAFDVPLAYPGSGFQVAVWQALIAIPYGRTQSYGEVARTIGKPRAARAVGKANGSNRIAIIIPCHRVTAAAGGPGGYGGGLWRKLQLLELERSGGPLEPAG